jgi:hypothetical protein
MKQINKDITDAEKSVKTFQKELGRLGANLSRIGTELSKNLSVPLAAVGTAIGVASLKTGEYASQLLSMSEATGLSTDSLQEFENVARNAGVSSDALLNKTMVLSNKLDEIAKGTGGAAEAMDKLGISVTNSDGSFRSMEELFPQVLGELNKLENTTERNNIAQTIFGGKIGDLAPVLALSSNELANLRKEAHDAGRIMGNDALVNADEFRIAVENLKDEFSVMTMKIASSFIPILQNQVIPLIYDKVVPAVMATAEKLKGLAEWFGNLHPEIQNVVIIFGAVVAAAGPVILVGGKMILMFKGLIGGVVGATGAFRALWVVMAANPIGGVITAVTGLVFIMTKLINRHKELKEVDALNKQSDELSKRSKWLYEEAMNAKKLVEEYKKLEGTAAFDPDEMERLQRSWERYAIELKNTSREMQGLGKLSKEDEENQRRRMRGISGLTDESKKSESTITDFQRAQNKKRIDDAREANKKRIEELNGIVKSYQEKINDMMLNEVELSEIQEEAAVYKLRTLNATEEQIDEVRIFYELSREKREREHAQEWENRLISQSGDRIKIMEATYKAEIVAAEKAGQDTAKIHDHYKIERENIEKDLAKKLEEANQVWIDRLQQQQDGALEAQRTSELNAAKERGESTLKMEISHAEARAALRERDIAAAETAALASAAETGADKLNIEEYYKNARLKIESDLKNETANLHKENADRIAQYYSSIVNFAQDTFNRIGSIAAGFSRNEEKRLSKEYKLKRDYINANVEDEEERAAQLAALDEEEEARKLAIQKENASREKALGIFNAIINTAAAITKALTAGPVMGPIMAGIIAGLGAAEIGVIASTPEPFYSGALLKGTPEGRIVRAGERNQDEVILPLERGTEQIAELLASALQNQGAASGAGQAQEVHYHIGTLIADESGLRNLERRLRPIRASEDRRLGVTNGIA